MKLVNWALTVLYVMLRHLDGLGKLRDFTFLKEDVVGTK